MYIDVVTMHAMKGRNFAPSCLPGSSCRHGADKAASAADDAQSACSRAGLCRFPRENLARHQPCKRVLIVTKIKFNRG